MQMRGASQDEIQRALYLAALSQFCIYVPTTAPVKSWPLRAGDPLFNAAMVKQSCTIKDFHHALRARDPLGIGFDSRDDPLLHLIWKLLTWDPLERMTAVEALQHPYFTVIDLDDTCSEMTVGNHNALESLALDPRMDIRNDETAEFTCPKCGRTFEDWQSCQKHVTSRKHAKFCMYDRRTLPTCLNAHSMLPAHPNSGYCDIQGRRRTIEDFHSIQLHPKHQFYGIFDGHTGNLASKYAAATAYKEISKRLAGLDMNGEDTDEWKKDVQLNLTDAFSTIHYSFLKAVAFSPVGVMDQSGTTATIVYVTDEAVVVASVGDSRAILSSKERREGDSITMTALQLTPDHVASDPGEKSLVEQRGGVVTSGGLPRVNGTLAITRSLGDARLSPWLSREPHVVTMSRRDMLIECGQHFDSDGLPCFIVLASDGLWDVVNNQEAVDMVAQVVQAHDERHGISWEDGGAFQEAAEVLTQEAYVRGSTDNIGVCVIALD
jgi:serine/threonine protein phosphatase PrpC